MLHINVFSNELACVIDQRKRSRKYYHAHSDVCKTRGREWKKQNPESGRTNRALYVKKHPDRVKATKAKCYSEVPIDTALWRAARCRAKRNNIPFSIDMEDVIVPLICPVFGITLMRGSGKQVAESPTLDRVEASLGYVKGNVRVISWKANRLKSDASLEDLESLVIYLREHRGANAVGSSVA